MVSFLEHAECLMVCYIKLNGVFMKIQYFYTWVFWVPLWEPVLQVVQSVISSTSYYPGCIHQIYKRTILHKLQPGLYTEWQNGIFSEGNQYFSYFYYKPQLHLQQTATHYSILLLTLLQEPNSIELTSYFG